MSSISLVDTVQLRSVGEQSEETAMGDEAG